MSEDVKGVVQRFLEEMSLDIFEERVLNYIVRELHLGRKLSSIIQDAYVKNRAEEEKLGHILENKEIIQAVEEELDQAFKHKDFKFEQ